ncbi:hypothetical protein LVD17_15045 [Fulvivirga ulvae]|uniref:hypothetical protein n=1 Tax=Fulvivirga ulvae TaxID=2904245 RepID=UPI001F2A3C73|nr:hypothetical protein [Fulvivirga ulvae]UII29615.1 hypothetical protein LVD17_15045 [Fulvivirga ulvae]
MLIRKEIQLKQNDNPFLTLYNLDNRYLYQQWIGRPTDENYIKAIDAISACLHKYSIKGTIVDLRLAIRSGAPMQTYAARMVNNYINGDFTKNYPNELFREILILPLDLLMRIAIDRYREQIEAPVKMVMANTLSDACQWLKLPIMKEIYEM